MWDTFKWPRFQTGENLIPQERLTTVMFSLFLRNLVTMGMWDWNINLPRIPRPGSSGSKIWGCKENFKLISKLYLINALFFYQSFSFITYHIK